MDHQKNIAKEDFNKVYAGLTDMKYEHNDIALKFSKLDVKTPSLMIVQGIQEYARKFVSTGIGYYHNTFNNKCDDL